MWHWHNTGGNAVMISGRFAEDWDKKKKKETHDESMPRKCILVANLFTELCGPRRHGDAIVAKDSL